MSTKRDNTSQGGFTLVELAVVLLIIGLIVGGILRGQELITSAQLNSVQTDANQIRTSVNTFQDKFVALPGDFANAKSAIDESGLSNSLKGSGSISGGKIGNGQIEGERTGSGTEATQAWAQMGAAGLINVDTNAINGNGYGTGSSQDAFDASVGGYYTLSTGVKNGFNLSSSNQEWIVLGEGDNSGVNSTGGLDPDQAAQIDRKADDGNPESGNVRGGSNGGKCVKSGSYDIENDSGACALALQL